VKRIGSRCQEPPKSVPFNRSAAGSAQRVPLPAPLRRGPDSRRSATTGPQTDGATAPGAPPPPLHRVAAKPKPNKPGKPNAIRRDLIVRSTGQRRTASSTACASSQADCQARTQRLPTWARFSPARRDPPRSAAAAAGTRAARAQTRDPLSTRKCCVEARAGARQALRYAAAVVRHSARASAAAGRRGWSRPPHPRPAAKRTRLLR
jgi:hypothetical protein